MALASIGHGLKDLSKKLGLSPDLMILEWAWEKESGALREYARIAALDNAALVVEADSSVVMQEISLRRGELLRKLNRHLPVPLLSRITVRMSPSHGR